MDATTEDRVNVRRYHHTNFQLAHLASSVKVNNLKVTVIIPAKEVAATISGVIRDTVGPLITAGIVSSTVVIDANSEDGTGEIAARHGVRVIQRADIAPELGPSLGKGDALWRGLKATDGQIVAFLDGDTGDPNPAHLLGILGPLLLDETVQMVRGCFDRPFRSPTGDIYANEGGRVTELTARPLLNLHFPQLAGFYQPLAGEFAARRPLLEQLSFPVGFGIEIGTLIDVWRLVGLKGLAQVDLGTRQNAHKSLRDLSPMATAVMATVERRRGNRAAGRTWLPWEERYRDVSVVERPPLHSYKNWTNGDIIHCQALSARAMPQVFRIPGVLNFRDIGGYPTTYGGHLRRNLIFRSADPSALSEEGRVQLQKLGIRKIFDLRTQREIKHHEVVNSVLEPWLLSSSGPDRIVSPVFQDDDNRPEILEQRLAGYSDENVEGAVKVYRSILIDSRRAVKAILSCLCGSQAPAPLLINCTAGKDRTGVVIMVLMLHAGCTTEDVAKEFHLSEEGLGAKWKSSHVARFSKKPIFFGKDRSVVERALGAREEVMMALIATVNDEWGNIENFLRHDVQLPPGVIRKSKMALQE